MATRVKLVRFISAATDHFRLAVNNLANKERVMLSLDLVPASVR